MARLNCSFVTAVAGEEGSTFLPCDRATDAAREYYLAAFKK